MKLKFRTLTFFLGLILLASCDSLNVKPNNIVTNDDVYSTKSGIKAYMARLYSLMPMRDFKFVQDQGFHTWYTPKDPATNTDNGLSRDAHSVAPEYQYWSEGYHLIRRANSFIETLPGYKDQYDQAQIDSWLGEAHFIRAFTYYKLAIRYGGVPIVTKVVDYPGTSIDSLPKPRASSKDVYELINKDLNFAAHHLKETSDRGRVNKYTAYAFKSRVMLFAGSIAKNNTIKKVDKRGNRIVGLPKDSAKSYFKKSYIAASKLNGHYHLYEKDWKPNDSEAQYKNYRNLFFAKDSPENIWVRYYKYPDDFHGYDAYNVPQQSIGPNGYGSGLNPTVSYVRLFSGLPKNPNGTIKLLDKNGDYKLFDNMGSLFKNAEPRLKATVIWPGAKFKGEKITVRRGIYTGSTNGGIPKLLPKGSRKPYPKKNLVTSANQSQTPYTLPNGDKMNPAGKSGIYTAFPFQTVTGFYVRKYLNPDLPQSQVLERHEDHPFILIRYAEVLLNRAEAAYQLYKMGETSSSFQADTFKDINKIRKRAGAPLLSDNSELNLNVIQKERRKELAFERLRWWDLIRTRTADKIFNGSTPKTINPFYVAKTGKYIYDRRYKEGNETYTFPPKWYYVQIPGGAISSNQKLIQNPGY